MIDKKVNVLGTETKSVSIEVSLQDLITILIDEIIKSEFDSMLPLYVRKDCLEKFQYYDYHKDEVIFEKIEIPENKQTVANVLFYLSEFGKNK